MTVPTVKRATVMPHIIERVLPASTIYTDEYRIYNPLGRKGYFHKRIAHVEKVYVSGDAHMDTIEGFFALASFSKASSTSLRVGTGISWPFGVFCVGYLPLMI